MWMIPGVILMILGAGLAMSGNGGLMMLGFVLMGGGLFCSHLADGSVRAEEVGIAIVGYGMMLILLAGFGFMVWGWVSPWLA